MDSLPENTGAGPLALAVLARFRGEFHACVAARADELTELADAVLCADGPVRCLAGLSLAQVVAVYRLSIESREWFWREGFESPFTAFIEKLA